MITAFAVTFLLPLLTLLLGYFGKGYYEKRKVRTDTDNYELTNYAELYQKMKHEFLKLHNEQLEYQNTVLYLRSEVSALTASVDKLRLTLETKEKTINDLRLENRTLKAQIGEAEIEL